MDKFDKPEPGPRLKRIRLRAIIEVKVEDDVSEDEVKKDLKKTLSSYGYHDYDVREVFVVDSEGKVPV